MEPQEGDIAEDGAGNFVVYKYGRWHPADETGRPLGPIDASSRWGSGARELPNGSVERVGPRGGVSVIANTPQGDEGVGRLTEGQGKAMLYGGMMAGAERDYQRARENGYDPASIRNQIAGVAGVIPFDGDYFGRLIRDDVSDAGRQAELRWAEGNLRQLTGAAAANPEIARVAAINFDRGNDQLAGQRYQTRAETYEGTRYAAGPGAAQLDPYPVYGLGGAGPVDETGLPTYPAIEGGQEIAPIPTGASIRRGPDGKSYAVVNSENIAPEDTPESLRAAGYQQDADGTWFRMVGSDLPPTDGGGGGGSARPGSGGEAAPAMGAIEARTADQGIGRRADTFVRGIADAATYSLSDEITAGLNTIAPLDRGTRGGWNGDWGGAYRQNHDLMRGIDELDAEQMPLTRGAGQLVGALAGGVGAARMAPQFMRQAPRIAGATRAADTARRGANVARLAAGGAAEGGAYGFGASEGNLLERAPDALEGAAIGGVLAPVAGVVGDAVIEPVVGGAVQAFNRTLRPHALVTQADEVAANMGNVLSDPRAQAVQTLTDNGVYLTSGQRAGGLAQTVENLAQRAPILGTAIRGARNRGQESLNRAVGNRALDSIGEGIPANIPAGGETVSYVSGRLGQEFDRAADMVPEISATPELREGVARVVAQASDLPEAGRQQLAGILESRLTRLDRPLTGTQYRDVEREIGTLAAQYGASPDPAQQQMGIILSGVGEELRTHLGRVNPEAGEILRNASDGWADFVRMRQASVASGGRPFSPGQLSTAVRTQDSSVAHGAVGRGEARMQDLSRAASTVMPDSYGNPGNADAAGWGGLGIGMLTAPVQTTGVAATLGAGALPYLAAGRNVVERLPAAASRQGDNVIRRFVARGFSEEEARGLTAAAVDPARARDVIDFLATRMNRQEARSMLRAIRFSASRGAGEYAGDEE